MREVLHCPEQMNSVGQTYYRLALRVTYVRHHALHVGSASVSSTA